MGPDVWLFSHWCGANQELYKQYISAAAPPPAPISLCKHTVTFASRPALFKQLRGANPAPPHHNPRPHPPISTPPSHTLTAGGRDRTAGCRVSPPSPTGRCTSSGYGFWLDVCMYMYILAKALCTTMLHKCIKKSVKFAEELKSSGCPTPKTVMLGYTNTNRGLTPS